MINSVKTQETFEPDTETNDIPTTTQQRRRYDRFDQWMKVIGDFFTQGNWLNGGPSNLLEYIARTITKLLDILMNRRGPPVSSPVDPSLIPPSSSTTNNNNRNNDNGNNNEFDDTFEYKVLDGFNKQQQQRRPMAYDRYQQQQPQPQQGDRSQKSLSDLIRMLSSN